MVVVESRSLASAKRTIELVDVDCVATGRLDSAKTPISATLSHNASFFIPPLPPREIDPCQAVRAGSSRARGCLGCRTGPILGAQQKCPQNRQTHRRGHAVVSRASGIIAGGCYSGPPLVS